MHRLTIRAAFAALVGLALGQAAIAAGSPEKGKTAFIVHGCFQCHGTVGQGAARESNGKVLYDTKLPLEALIAFVRGTNRAMPAYSEKILSDADLTDIYAYLESLPKPADYKTIPLLNQP
jgi:ubiquinol-cytochrome c reductase cytochrome c subunit